MWHFWCTEWHSTAEIQAKLWVTLRDIFDGVTFHCGDSGEFLGDLRDISDVRSDIPLRRLSVEIVGDFAWHLWKTEWHSTGRDSKLWMTLRDISDVRSDIPLRRLSVEIVGDFTWHFWWSDIPLRRFRRICGWLYVTFLMDGVTFHCGDSG